MATHGFPITVGDGDHFIMAVGITIILTVGHGFRAMNGHLPG